MYADQAVLIPELLEGLPFGVFATSSIDALVHAVESSLSPKATPYTKLFGYKAIEMLIRGYQTIAREGRADVHVHLYGKRESRPLRKMGHITFVGLSGGQFAAEWAARFE